MSYKDELWRKWRRAVSLRKLAERERYSAEIVAQRAAEEAEARLALEAEEQRLMTADAKLRY
jgi:hypothetical protein